MNRLIICAFLLFALEVVAASFSVPAKKKYSIHYAFFGSPHTAGNRMVIGPGEYYNSIIDRLTGFWYDCSNTVPTLLTPTHMWKNAGGAHHVVALDSSGNVWAYGDNTNGELGDGTTTSRSTPVKILIDSLGNAFTNIIKVMCGGTQGGWMSAALKADGTMWVWGATDGGVRGNNTWGGGTTRPVQIPASRGMKDALISELCISLDSSGNVYTWGAGGVGGGAWTPDMLAQGSGSTYHTNTPTQITLPAPAIMIAGGAEYMNYALLNTGKLYAWGHNLLYCGVFNRSMSFYSYNPFDDTDSLGFTTGSVDTICVNSMSTAVILTDSTLRMWGDNSCANMGMGAGINFRTYRVGNQPGGAFSPWGWDGGQGEAMQLKPVQPALGKHNFTKIFGCVNFCFGWYAEDANDSVYSWGRNKYQIVQPFQTELSAANGNLGATYPNNWDKNYLTYINLFRTSAVVRTTGRICVDSPAGTLCSTFPWDNSKAGPTANAGINQTVSTSFATLRGSSTIASGVSGKLNALWTCTAKPAGAPNPYIPLRANDTIAVSNMTTQGVYTFKYWVEDSNFKTDSTTVQVTVGCVNCFIRPRAGRHKYINL